MTRRDEMSTRVRSGFTLAETMMAMLIMAFVGLIVTGGLMMGLNTYRKIVEKSNAELLLSTTVSELRDELDRAEEITLSGSALSKYRSSTSGWRVLKSEQSNESKRGIWVTEYQGYELKGSFGDSAKKKEQRLVTEAAATEELYAGYDSITYSNGVFTVSNLQVCRKKDNKVLAKVAETGDLNYYIRSLEKPRVYNS